MNIHGVSETQGINQDDFVRICPSLIRQLQKGACSEQKPGSSKVDEDSSKMLRGKLFGKWRRVLGLSQPETS